MDTQKPSFMKPQQVLYTVSYDVFWYNKDIGMAYWYTDQQMSLFAKNAEDAIKKVRSTITRDKGTRKLKIIQAIYRG